MTSPRVMIVGGDNTSDLYGAELASKLIALCPDICLFGIGGARMGDAGVRLLYDISELVSIGVFDSLKGVQIVKRLIKRVSESMNTEKPDLVIQIGLPVFSFRLLELAKCKGVPVMYYYTPFSRGFADIKKARFAEMVNYVASISKFEEQLCKELEIAGEFVGHPLIDLAHATLSRDEAREKFGLGADSKVITLLPGAREVEVKTILPTLLKAVRRVMKSVTDVETVVSVASTLRPAAVQKIIGASRVADVKIVEDTYNVLKASDLAIVSIGSVSLQAALIGTPSLAVYKVPTTTYLLDKVLARKAHLAATNIVLGQAAIPELIQNEFGEGRIAEETVRLLNDQNARAEILESYNRLPAELGNLGALQRAAEYVLRILAVLERDKKA